MYFLVRKQTGRGEAEALDTEYQGDQLTLGSGEQSMVQLPGVAGLLQLRAGGGGVRARGRKLRFSVAGKQTDKATLSVGDVLSLPGFELELITAPSGFDLALLIRPAEQAAAILGDPLELDKVTWSLRRWSWMAALLVLVLCLLLPAAGLLRPELAGQLRQLPLPDDGLWSSGPLVAAHQTSGIAGDCQACHSTPFVMVEDRACLACHRDITEHVDIERHPPELFAGERCASCHREHNEPARLVRRDNGLCVDCHARPGDWPAAPDLEAVSAFTEEDHPGFRLALLTPRGPGGVHGWETERVRPGSGPQRERSNLKFTHEVHMNPEKVQHEATGQALDCASCHTLKDDGEHFEAVTMDQHCRSCHGLSFDIFEPELELPHGDLRAAIVAMEAHFIREFTDPDLRRERAGEKPRRVPGKRESAATCEGTGLDCGRREALKEAEYQFANSGCITCHEVTETGLSDINDRWYVQPIRITGDWYPHSRFDHSSHLSLAWEGEGQVCEACHEASASGDARDILIPGRDNCLACHDDGQSVAAVNCVSCHAYHQGGGTAASQARQGPTPAAQSPTQGGRP